MSEGSGIAEFLISDIYLSQVFVKMPLKLQDTTLATTSISGHNPS